MNQYIYLTKNLLQITALFVAGILLFISFEPVVVRSATDSEEFTVSQEITEEVSITLSTTTVTMVGPIAGFTGGTATGTLGVSILSNTGYNVTLAFDNSPAMLGETSGNTGILNYTPGAGTPTYSFATGTSAYFGYSVHAQTQSDLVAAFLNNGSACGSGSQTLGRCWKAPSTTPFTIMDRATSALAGATSTITFVVRVPNNPSPALDADWYTATATLTATTQ